MLHVLLEPASPRARYVVRHVFERMLGWPFVLVTSREELRSVAGPKLLYGPTPEKGAYHVPACGWLADPGPAGPRPTISGNGRDLVLFPVSSGHDVFAAIFHLIALEEEYAITHLDEHGRIRADELTLVERDAHGFPIADRWALNLASELRTAFPSLPQPQRRYSHVLTVDMDNGLKYTGRSWQRAMGASLKDLIGGTPGRLLERWKVRTGNAPDPYASFVDRLSEVRDKVDRMISFVLTRGEGRYDHAARIDHAAFAALLKQLVGFSELGLHPSYASSREERLILHERGLLERASGAPIHISRQHFLRWRMPDTFRALIATGIQEDHSMGFSDRSGFRAGTCTPFPWYDLERDEETTLMLHPFAVMDSALANRTGDGLLKSISAMEQVCDAVREVNGTFVSVWHDRFLSGHEEFKGGPEAMRELVMYAKA